MAALERFESGAEVNLLISDIMLGVNQPHGVSLGNMMKLRRTGIRTIYVTASADALARVGPFDTVFEKPVHLDRLAAAVESALSCSPKLPSSRDGDRSRDQLRCQIGPLAR
jgi:DNA-binding NtrC family response regulator